MANKKSFQLKGGLCTLTSLRILNDNLSILEEELAKSVKRTPKFFHHAPIIIDLMGLAGSSIDFDLQRLLSIIRAHWLIPVGIRSSSDELQKQAIQAGLAVFPAEKEKLTTEPSPLQHPSKLITHPIRSGQQIYAKGDLIILNSVSPGAEILADGNIHVYGPLRGRALAGILGNTSARIFCQSLEAELVSIAGLYLVSENLEDVQTHQFTQIYLEDNQLQVRAC